MNKTRIIIATVMIALLSLSVGFVILFPYDNMEPPDDIDTNNVSPGQISGTQGTEGLIYKLDGDGKSYTLIGYEGDAIDILVPTYYEGLPVLEIAKNAFYNKKICSIIISEGIISIGEAAFRQCTSLEHVELPSTLTHIDSAVFTSTKIKTIVLPDNLKVIPNNTFLRCTELAHVKLPDSLETIESNAFSLCEDLKRIVFPKNIKTISNVAFESSGLESIELPSGIEKIERNAFYKSPITTVYYDGTLEQWKNIDIESRETIFSNSMSLHCTDVEVTLNPDGTIAEK